MWPLFFQTHPFEYELQRVWAYLSSSFFYRGAVEDDLFCHYVSIIHTDLLSICHIRRLHQTFLFRHLLGLNRY